MAVPQSMKLRRLPSLAPWMALVILSTGVRAEPVTSTRIEALTRAERAQWKSYVAASETNALLNQTVLQAEVTANKLPLALSAPGGGDFKLSAKPGHGWYASKEATGLADTVLSYQTPAGGWSKHTAYSRGPRQPAMQWTSQSKPGQPFHYVATFDNRATTEELRLLAGVWQATKREDCKQGFIKGLNFILAAQYPNGGWPQVYPLEGDYHDDITFNDDAMTHILELLQEIKNDAPHVDFLEPGLRQQAAAALAAGIRCVLQTQIKLDGKKTGWCAQYDALTLRPSSARKMEPATLSGLESSHVVKFMMTITNPTPEVVASIEAGLDWLENVQITGLARTKREGKTVYESNPASKEIYWARFYNLTNSQPVFPGRDGVLYDSFEAMAARNRLGYDYLTTLPGSIIKNGQKNWRRMLAAH
jgi:PelA/Pel-15E family pectate lyase